MEKMKRKMKTVLINFSTFKCDTIYWLLRTKCPQHFINYMSLEITIGFLDKKIIKLTTIKQILNIDKNMTYIQNRFK